MNDQVRLFAYGTLQVAEIWQAVTGCLFAGRPACLPDHACHLLRGHAYPGLRPWPGAVTQGMLFEGLDAAAWRLLDDYEDAVYRRETVTVTSNDDGRRHEAAVYMLQPAFYGLLSAEPWSTARFRRDHLPHFLADCAHSKTHGAS